MLHRFDIHHFKLKLLWLNFLNTDTKSKLRDKYPHFIAVLKTDMAFGFCGIKRMSNSGGLKLAARNET